MTDEPAVVRLSRELCRNFELLPSDVAPVELATHIKKFWEPRMRHELMAHIRAGDPSLEPLVVDAFAHLLDEDYDHVAAGEPSGG